MAVVAAVPSHLHLTAAAMAAEAAVEPTTAQRTWARSQAFCDLVASPRRLYHRSTRLLLLLLFLMVVVPSLRLMLWRELWCVRLQL